MTVVTFFKDPDAVLDYSFDWNRWLGSDTITSSSWTVPAGITEGANANTTTTTTVWLSGGTIDTSYTILNRIVTTAGRTDDRSFVVTVVGR